MIKKMTNVSSVPRSGDRTGSPAVNTSEEFWSEITLFDCEPYQAEAMGMFVAAAIENRVKHLDGFRSGMVMASENGRYLLEYLVWQAKESLAAVQENPAYAEHRTIVEAHTTWQERVVGKAARRRPSKPLALTRGNTADISLSKNTGPSELDELHADRDSPGFQIVIQITLGDQIDLHVLGGVLNGSIDIASPLVRAVNYTVVLQERFMVVESINAPVEGEKFPLLYRLHTMKTDPTPTATSV